MSVLLAAAPAQGRYAVVTVGGFYDAGDFGTPDESRAFVLPLSLRGVWRRFDVGATASLVRLETSRGVTVIEGTATPTLRRGTERVSRTGVGDVLLKARLYWIEDPGRGEPLPAVTPFFKVKLPTAGRRLGTGETDYGFGVELDKSFPPFFLFGDAAYTFIGRPEDLELRDRTALGLGAGIELAPRVSLSGGLDWRRSIVPGAPDPLEAVFALRFPLSESVSASPSGVIGLSDGSPDYGAGLVVSRRFGGRR